MNTSALIFNRQLLRYRQARASAQFHQHDFLYREMALRVAERIADFGQIFPVVLQLGARTGQLRTALTGSPYIGQLIQTDMGYPLLKQASGMRVVAEEEALPFAEQTVNAAFATGAFQWINDVPGVLAQVQRLLTPGGLFLGIFPGGTTLIELREAVTEASLAEEGGVHPRLSPMIDAREATALLQRAGFAEPVVDSERIQVTYGNAYALMRDLRGMAETNAVLAAPKHFMRRATMAAIADYYQTHFSQEARIIATFELVTLTGWKP